MIKVDKFKVEMDGRTDKLVKELCFALITIRFEALDGAIDSGIDAEAFDSQFKMLVLGGIANSLSDEEDGFISEEHVVQKLHEIAERAFEADKDGINWKEELN